MTYDTQYLRQSIHMNRGNPLLLQFSDEVGSRRRASYDSTYPLGRFPRQWIVNDTNLRN